MATPTVPSTVTPRSAERSEVEAVARSTAAASAADTLGMMMRASTLTLLEVMVSVISFGWTPSNLPASVDLNVYCALSSKSEISPASVRVTSRTGL